MKLIDPWTETPKELAKNRSCLRPYSKAYLCRASENLAARHDIYSVRFRQSSFLLDKIESSKIRHQFERGWGSFQPSDNGWYVGCLSHVRCAYHIPCFFLSWLHRSHACHLGLYRPPHSSRDCTNDNAVCDKVVAALRAGVTSTDSRTQAAQRTYARLLRTYSLKDAIHSL